MLKKVWSYTVDFCIRFRTSETNIESATALSDSTCNFVLITRKEGGA